MLHKEGPYVHERWLGKFERRAKWNFCLTAAMVAADQERR
jgi:hypothetical protein